MQLGDLPISLCTLVPAALIRCGSATGRFLAQHVFLLVERLLIDRGDVAIQMSHVALFLPDLAIVLMERGGLRRGEVSFLHFLVDALVLIDQSVVYLSRRGCFRAQALSALALVAFALSDLAISLLTTFSCWLSAF